MTTNRFQVTFDYRCPFARNAHEHLVTALQAGAAFEVDFVPFSLNQAHVEEGGTPVWDDPDKAQDLLAGQVGLVVRDRFPDQFLATHVALFSLRHDDAGDLRDEAALRATLAANGVDADAVFEEIAGGEPLEAYRKAHEAAVADHQVFGVPTFILGDEAAFVRIMTRPQGDAELATRTIAHIVELLAQHPDLNEFKHTSIAR